MLTPYPTDESKRRQWFTVAVQAINNTPGNSIPVLFENLPVPAIGQIATITDSPSDVWGTSVTIGGGALTVGLFWNGTNWTICAK